MIPERHRELYESSKNDRTILVGSDIRVLCSELGAAEAKVERMTAFLEAFVVAYKEPVEGPWFELRAFAESQGIYADDLGRDRILLRIAQAALNGPVSK